MEMSETLAVGLSARGTSWSMGGDLGYVVGKPGASPPPGRRETH